MCTAANAVVVVALICDYPLNDDYLRISVFSAVWSNCCRFRDRNQCCNRLLLESECMLFYIVPTFTFPHLRSMSTFAKSIRNMK